jgi:hypothetical protein
MSSQGFQFQGLAVFEVAKEELSYSNGAGAFSLTQQKTSGESDAPNQDRQTGSHLPAAVAANDKE